MGITALPKDPPEELIMSMALRFDHGLGCGGYYDALYGDGEHQKRLDSTLLIMRQLYEEVSGHGFYKYGTKGPGGSSPCPAGATGYAS